MSKNNTNVFDDALSGSTFVANEIKNLIENISGNKTSKKLILNTQETVHVVNSEDITRCESDGSYTLVYLKDRKLMMSKKLKDFEELLGLSLKKLESDYESFGKLSIRDTVSFLFQHQNFLQNILRNL